MRRSRFSKVSLTSQILKSQSSRRRPRRAQRVSSGIPAALLDRKEMDGDSLGSRRFPLRALRSPSVLRGPVLTAQNPESAKFAKGAAKSAKSVVRGSPRLCSIRKEIDGDGLGSRRFPLRALRSPGVLRGPILRAQILKSQSLRRGPRRAQRFRQESQRLCSIRKELDEKHNHRQTTSATL